MFVILIAIQIVLLMYGSPDDTHNVIWDFVTQISQWGSLGFVLGIVGISSGIYLENTNKPKI